MPSTVIQPFAPRHVTTDLGGTLRITLPSRKQWLVLIPSLLFVLVWGAIVLSAVVFGGAALLGALRTGPLAPEDGLPLIFVGVWLLFFSVGGVLALYTVLWIAAGSEVLEVTRQSVRVSRRIPGWTRTQEYLAAHVQDLRVSPAMVPVWPRRRSGWRSGLIGTLAFDYGARTIRCFDADEAEAKMVLAEIQQRFPQYGAGESGN